MEHEIGSTFDGTRDYLKYGHAGLELARTMERRAHALDRRGHASAPTLLIPARRWLGARMIGLGPHVAGAPASAPAGAK